MRDASRSATSASPWSSCRSARSSSSSSLFLHNKNGDANFTAASIISAAILTLPNFYANKRFVWKDTNKDNLRTQVLVFWVAAMLGVTAGDGAHRPRRARDAGHRTTLVQAICVFFAQCVGFGLVWIGRYLLLDKWLFRVDPPRRGPDAGGRSRAPPRLPHLT